MAARDRLLCAAKELIWERGVEATSPGDLLSASGVGQGSLYHHFHGKTDWATAAIAALADDLEQETLDLLTGDRPGLERLLDYLTKPRTALAGCRLGRLAFDPAVIASPELAAPVHAYAATSHGALTAAIADACDDGDLPPGTDANTLASTVLATVQGGYVLARMSGRAGDLTDAVAGLESLLGAREPRTHEEDTT